MQEFVFDKLVFRVYGTRAEMGAAAAADVVKRMTRALEARGQVNVLFAAAPSQSDMLAALKAYDFPWNKVSAFHMDEYVGLPTTAPQAFSTFLRREIWNDLPLASVYPIDGNNDVAAECARYTRLLQEHPIDLVLCGIGENCHLAFNDPEFADFDDVALIKPVDLDPVCRQQQVNDGCFASLDVVPRQALTLTMPVFARAPEVVCVVPAPTKVHAVYNTAHQPCGPAYPSTILRRHPSAVLYADKDSGARLIAEQ